MERAACAGVEEVLVWLRAQGPVLVEVGEGDGRSRGPARVACGPRSPRSRLFVIVVCVLCVHVFSCVYVARVSSVLLFLRRSPQSSHAPPVRREGGVGEDGTLANEPPARAGCCMAKPAGCEQIEPGTRSLQQNGTESQLTSQTGRCLQSVGSLSFVGQAWKTSAHHEFYKIP